MDERKKIMGKNIKKIREYRGLTGEKFGLEIGLTQSMVSKLETGKRNIDKQTLKLIERILEVPENYFEELYFKEIGYKKTTEHTNYEYSIGNSNAENIKVAEKKGEDYQAYNQELDIILKINEMCKRLDKGGLEDVYKYIEKKL